MPILYNPKTPQLAKLAEGTDIRFIEDVRREAAEQRKKKQHKEQEEEVPEWRRQCIILQQMYGKCLGFPGEKLTS